jgi:hypothetical protein
MSEYLTRNARFISTRVGVVVSFGSSSRMLIGSSPRAWRSFEQAEVRINPVRFISHALEKLPAPYPNHIVSVHLHARGEVAMRRTHAAAMRFISTRVEKLHSTPTKPESSAVHLHARGEVVERGDRALTRYGSSPRAWRSFLLGFSLLCCDWFISTRVEKLFSARALQMRTAVHLHARGEVGREHDGDLRARGSSPRAWRSSSPRASTRHTLRFISTRVEKLHGSPQRDPRGTVHLHARGEVFYRADRRVIQGRFISTRVEKFTLP